MKLVVDSNILFTFFWKNSIIRTISYQSVELFAPEYALSEIDKYSSILMKKTNHTTPEFFSLKNDLIQKIQFVKLEEYSSLFPKTLHLTKKLSNKQCLEFINDIDFFALSLKIDCPIWSNDKNFKKQNKIIVFNTKEIIELFELLQ
jgi:predicted nucleic acid-binding protein